MAEATYRTLADVILALHVGVVAFVVGGLVLIIVGKWRGWQFVEGWWFRLAHLAAIGVVAAQAWLGVVCPLTTLENWLRGRSRQSVYDVGFVEYWLETVLYYDVPPWVFTLLYTAFALAVIAAWWRFPPRRR